MPWLLWQAVYWLALYLSVGLMLGVLLTVSGCGVRPPGMTGNVDTNKFWSSCDHVCLDQMEKALVESYIRNGK